MRTLLDAPTRAEFATYQLAFTCERCAQFDEPTGRCSLEYPNEEHRDADLRDRTEIVFCKEFELA